MRPSRRPIIIATRRSRLAQAQAGAVADALRRLYPSVEVRLLPLETEGDRLTDKPLGALGGKGLFTRAIEQALLHSRADIAVHSLKDLPLADTGGLVLAAIPARGDVRDCLIAHSARSIDDLPQGATAGTSSLRRAAQLKRLRPDLRIESLRGNIETRLRRVLEERRFDMTLLAAAGLQRAGLGRHADKPLDTARILPEPGQAALTLQCRADDHVTLRRCLPLNDATTAACVQAERAVAAALGADCRSPMAVLAEVALGDSQGRADTAGKTRLRARVLSADGSTCLEADHTGTLKSIRQLTQTVIDDLLRQGAQQVLHPVVHATTI